MYSLHRDKITSDQQRWRIRLAGGRDAWYLPSLQSWYSLGISSHQIGPWPGHRPTLIRYRSPLVWVVERGIDPVSDEEAMLMKRAWFAGRKSNARTKQAKEQINKWHHGSSTVHACPKAQKATFNNQKNQNILALFHRVCILYLNQNPLTTDVTSRISAATKQRANQQTELDQQLTRESERP